MRTVNIDVTKIDKTAMYKGKSGTYLNITLFENKSGPDKFGNDGYVTQDLGKERRQAGEKAPIIGNWKRIGGQKAKPAPVSQTSDGDAAPWE